MCKRVNGPVSRQGEGRASLSGESRRSEQSEPSQPPGGWRFVGPYYSPGNHIKVMFTHRKTFPCFGAQKVWLSKKDHENSEGGGSSRRINLF